MQGQRIERVAQQIRQEIAGILQRDLPHARLEMVTVTHVDLSKDLSHAKVYYSCLGDADQKDAAQAELESDGRFIQSLLKKRLRLKRTPNLHFFYDPTIDRNIAISDVLMRAEDEQSTDETGKDQ